LTDLKCGYHIVDVKIRVYLNQKYAVIRAIPNFADKAKERVKNPFGIITVFVSLIYRVASLVLTTSTLRIASFVLVATTLSSCGDHGDKSNISAEGTPQILLFSGTGTSPNDVAAVETILNSNRLNYSTTNSSQLNGMSESEIRRYRLLIVPGGNFIDIGNSLTSGTAANIRNAVYRGLNYLGICAGGFFAGNSSYYNSLNLTSGMGFGFYSAENEGIRKAAVAIAVPGTPTLDQYWENGPQFTGWGAVVGKYPDGTPAIVEGVFGSGWVILTGVHAEAPEGWRREMTFNTPARVDNAYAGVLIRAALNRVSLSHF
jgi:glutamine amidotransferase-like uncharacterized protein